MAKERTLVFVKPDGVQRGLIGRVISRFEDKGLKIVGLKMMKLSEPLVEEHYAHHKDKPFFPRLKEFMTSAPIVAMVLEGVEAVSVVRKMVGVTNSRKAEPGTIRGDFSNSFSTNVVHASESPEIAEIEIKRFFSENELIEWERILDKVTYAPDEQ